VELAEVTSSTRVLEVGAGLGALTLALAETGAEVVAVERDPRLIPALVEVVGSFPRVRIVVQDALAADWRSLLRGRPWVVVANLPYNVAVPVVMGLLESEPRVSRLVVMVQREVGERLCARPGHPQFGAVSLRVAYRAEARVIRRVPPSVFWPRPNVESVLVSMTRRPPPVRVDHGALWRTIEVSFQQRRKTMRGAMIRLGLDSALAEEALRQCGIRASQRPEELGLAEFACLAERWRALASGAAP
jgi:16S rRNA (adenine1518-N6/adenine1519-N6)-dimethyltransferase